MDNGPRAYSTRCSRAGRVCQDKKAAMEADGDLAWEMSILRYDALVKACEAAHNHRKWWLCHTARDGPSKWFGVVFHKPSWAVGIKVEGVSLHVGTCEDEDSAGHVADFARVALGLAPKNFPALWDSIKAWVEAKEKGGVPAVELVELHGIKVSAFTAKIKAAVDAADATVTQEGIAMFLYRSNLARWGDAPGWAENLAKKNIRTFADLARANMDDVASASTTPEARAWRKKPAEHQRVRDCVANRSIPWLIG